jgi:ribosomal-protein-alanine N-acetyltransferase
MSRVAPPGPVLRPYRPSDFDTLVEIDQACFPKRIAYDQSEFRGYLQAEGAYCVVAVVKETIAGFILTERYGSLAHIITLDVLESHRRQSIATRLLENAEQEAVSQGAVRMVLETATTNKPAIALWKKRGYRETGIIPNYYGRGLDAHEMQKILRPYPEGN